MTSSLKSINELIQAVPQLQEELIRSINQHSEEWDTFLRSPIAESCVPSSLCVEIRQNRPIGFCLIKLILLKTFRIEHFLAGLQDFIVTIFIFGNDFFPKEVNLANVYHDTNQTSPVYIGGSN